MYRLEHRWAGAIRIEVARRREADTPGYRATEIGEDVAEQVVGDDHVVTLRRLHEIDAGRVDVVVSRLDVGELGRHFVERALPEIAGEGQHVRLVYEREMFAIAFVGQIERVTNTAFDTEPGVDRTLRRDLVRRALAQEAALARVGALGVLPDDDEVVTAIGIDERPLVHVEIEIETHLQQESPLDDAGRHLRSTDRAHQERVEPSPLLDHLVGQDRAVPQVPSSTEVVVDRVQIDTRGAHDLQSLGDDLDTDAIASDDANLVTHDLSCGETGPWNEKTAHQGGRSKSARRTTCATE